eukprot:6188295-Pleurochrysis_carterae.AAC.3
MNQIAPQHTVIIVEKGHARSCQIMQDCARYRQMVSHMNRALHPDLHNKRRNCRMHRPGRRACTRVFRPPVVVRRDAQRAHRLEQLLIVRCDHHRARVPQLHHPARLRNQADSARGHRAQRVCVRKTEKGEGLGKSNRERVREKAPKLEPGRQV